MSVSYMKTYNLNALSHLPYFDLPILTSQFPLSSKRNLQILLSNWHKRGKVHRLSNGRYVTKEAYLKFSTDARYGEYLASVFSYPSYLSGEYVLAKSNALTEGIFPYTSVTLKEKKSITNPLGAFIYHQIKPKLFTGFTSNYFLTYEYFTATPAKALFDYLYFQSRLLTPDIIRSGLAEHLRLNLDSFTSQDIDELKKYASLSASPKLLQLCTHLF